MKTEPLNIKEGSVAFWTTAGKIKFNDDKTTPIVSVDPEGGSIFIVKDDDNKLKVFYVVLGKGRFDLEYDVSSLESEKKHMVAFTWNLPSKEANLYLDGQLVVSKPIELE